MMTDRKIISFSIPRFFFCIVGLFISGLPVGCGLRCLQCSTFEHSDCMSGGQPAKECSEHDANHCITFYGYLRGGTMAKRDCIRPELVPESLCTDKVMEDLSVRICYQMCDIDGCNNEPIASADVTYQRLVSGARDMRAEALRMCVCLATLWSLLQTMVLQTLVSTNNVLF